RQNCRCSIERGHVILISAADPSRNLHALRTDDLCSANSLYLRLSSPPHSYFLQPLRLKDITLATKALTPKDEVEPLSPKQMISPRLTSIPLPSPGKKEPAFS